MRVDTPRRELHTLRPPRAEYADSHAAQQAQHTTYADSEWHSEWVDEKMRAEREVEIGGWEEQFIRKLHGVYIQPGLSCMQERTDNLLRRLEGWRWRNGT